MGLSSRTRVGEFKSNPYERARSLLQSRNTQAARAQRKTAELRQAQKEIEALRRENRELREEQQKARRRSSQLQAEIQVLKNEPVRLPDDPPLAQHCFGPKMISLCVSLSEVIGLRSVETTLKMVFDWLGVTTRIPDWTTVRTWLCRFGVATLKEPIEAADDWIWVVDHSNQLGVEKALVILGIRAKDLPPIGQPLKHEDMQVLAVVPAERWKQEDVAEQYSALAKRIGEPLAVLSDGAPELRESVAVLKTPEKPLIQLRDFKHRAANAFKKMLDRDLRYDQFLRQLGRTRNAIQQTELAYLFPPAQKQKARFMNLAATWHWAEMARWHMLYSDSSARNGITEARMEEKLGWLKLFESDVARWSRCQSVISEALTWINGHGVYIGAADELRSKLGELDLTSCKESQAMAEELVGYVSEAEEQLTPGMRLPQSTEILESGFGRYKAVEGQHSKGGFTSLLAAFPALFRRCTPEAVRAAFTRTPVSAVKEWTQKALGKTFAAKRKQAYQEFARSTPVAKMIC